MGPIKIIILLLFLLINSCCSFVPEAPKYSYGDQTRFEDFEWVEDAIERAIVAKIYRAKMRIEPSLSIEMVVSVDKHGAIGDGVTDDREAFEKAWNEACSLNVSQVVLLVPENRKYLLKPLTFYGSCNSDITVMIKGTLVASTDRSHWDDTNTRHWILFDGVKNLVVKGGGTIDGKGHIWWQNSCKINENLPCTVAPTAMTFYSCKNLRVENLRLKNSQQIHLSFEKCVNVEVSKLFIVAPGKSPNTDGIHVAHTKNMVIYDCIIRTGDDCISIVSGSRNVKGMDIICGPGHGISIGSLGANNSRVSVRNVMMDRVKLIDTKNGVRIKTWQGGRGYAKGIIFQNIEMYNVENPIIIDQNYCDSSKPCHEQDHAVRISRVLYKNIKGISASKVALKLNCSEVVPCQRVVLQDIQLVEQDGDQPQSLCNNVNWVKSGYIIPPCA